VHTLSFFDNDLAIEVQGDLQEVINLDQINYLSSVANGKSRDTQSTNIKELCIPHPLKVVVHFNALADQNRHSVEFFFYPHLKFTSARACSPYDEFALTTLYPNDAGNTVPSATSHILNEVESFQLHNFNQLIFGRPFMWAQTLCGFSRHEIGCGTQPTEEVRAIHVTQDFMRINTNMILNQIKEKIAK